MKTSKIALLAAVALGLAAIGVYRGTTMFLSLSGGSGVSHEGNSPQSETIANRQAPRGPSSDVPMKEPAPIRGNNLATQTTEKNPNQSSSHSGQTQRRPNAITETKQSAPPSPWPATRVPLLTTAQRTRQRMEPYFERRGFTEDERVLTIELLTESTASFGDIASVSRKEGLSATALATLATDSLKHTEQRLTEFLGAERASEVMALKNTTYLRQTVVEDFVKRCALMGMPISTKTADDVGILLRSAALTVGSHNEGPISQDRYQLRITRDPVAIAAAGKVLTPQQTELLKLSLAERFKIAK